MSWRKKRTPFLVTLILSCMQEMSKNGIECTSRQQLWQLQGERIRKEAPGVSREKFSEQITRMIGVHLHFGGYEPVSKETLFRLPDITKLCNELELEQAASMLLMLRHN